MGTSFLQHVGKIGTREFLKSLTLFQFFLHPAFASQCITLTGRDEHKAGSQLTKNREHKVPEIQPKVESNSRRKDGPARFDRVSLSLKKGIEAKCSRPSTAYSEIYCPRRHPQIETCPEDAPGKKKGMKMALVNLRVVKDRQTTPDLARVDIEPYTSKSDERVSPAQIPVSPRRRLDVDAVLARSLREVVSE